MHGIVQKMNLFSTPNISKKIFFLEKIGVNVLFLHVSNTHKASSKSPEETLNPAMEMADIAAQLRELGSCSTLEPATTSVAQNIVDGSKPLMKITR